MRPVSSWRRKEIAIRQRKLTALTQNLALVRPILEYGQQASSPSLRRDIALMECIQRLATRIVKGMRELLYEGRLRRLNMFSLEYRRFRGNLILAYNIFHGRLDLPLTEFFEAPSDGDLRGHFELRHNNFRLLQRKAAFSVRLFILWNKVPMEIVNSHMLDTFKWLLDLAWISLFPSHPWLPCSLNFYFTWFEALTSAVVFDEKIWFDLKRDK